jgi:mono/diheme cytochrome c family protein
MIGEKFGEKISLQVNLSFLRSLLACFCLTAILSACNFGNVQPSIEVDQRKFDFGKVKEGIELKHSFTLKNGGSTKLTLYEAYSTCGCTVPKLAKNELKAGETTSLDVVVDTAMKQDKVTKTVFVSSDDPAHPVLPIDLSMDVENAHTGMTDLTGTKIFTDQHCASCHVDQGVGLYGKDLFEADCAMCHGIAAQGAVGPALRGPYNNKVFAAHIKDVISHGSKTHRSMPGFLGDNGGPLTEKQIESIVKYLSSLPISRDVR